MSNVEQTGDSVEGTDSLAQFEESLGDPNFPGNDASDQAMKQYTDQVEIYSQEMLQCLKENNFNGEYLWLEFTSTFRVRTVQSMSPTMLSKWIKFLRDNGVYIKSRRGYPKWKALRDCLLQERFTLEPLQDIRSSPQPRNYIPPENLPQDIMPQINRNGRGSTVTSPQDNRTFSNATGSTVLKSNVDSVVKSYNSRKKFRGDFDEDFNEAIQQFETVSLMFELNEVEKAKAFPAILEGSAFNHYSRTFLKTTPTYQDQVDVFRLKYISEERQQRILQLWQKPSLCQAMRQQPEKSELQVFREFCDNLSSIQRQLHSSYHNDLFLRDQLMVAADIEDIQRLLMDKIPNSSHEAMQRIAARLSNEPRSAGINNIYSDSDHDINYSLRSRYGGKARKHLKSYKYRKKRSSLSTKLAAVPGCWVCKKQHRARDNHSQNEVMEAVNRIKKTKPDSTFNCNMLSDVEWALTYETDSSDSDEDILKDQDKNENREDEAQMALECELANNSFCHGSSFINYRDHCYASMNCQLSKGEYAPFDGVIIDTGANRSSVISLAQYKAYCQQFGVTPNIKGDAKSLIGLGKNVVQAIGHATIPIPFVDLDKIIDVDFRVISQSQSTLLSLSDLKRNGLDISIQDETVSFKHKIQTLVYENDFLKHKWNPWESSIILYTEQELQRLHRNFGHPSVSTLRKVLKTANPSEMDSITKKAIEDLTRKCDICQKHATAPRRFKLTVGCDDLRFNHVVAADIMYVKRKPILHMVDEATHFMAATFLRNHTSEQVWKGLMKCWSRVYLGPPDHLRIDQGSNFISREFLDNAESDGITVLEAPIESPSTMSHSERYHGPLRNTYTKIRECMPRTETDADCLQLAVKCLNDTVGPEGLCPTVLVYGTFPKLTRRTPAESQIHRARTIDKASEQLLKEYAKRKVAFGLRHTHSPKGKEQEDDLSKLPFGSPVYVYRDKPKQWEGPFKFVNLDGNTVTVQLPHGRRIFRSTAVKAKNPTLDDKLESRNPLDGPASSIRDSPLHEDGTSVNVADDSANYFFRSPTMDGISDDCFKQSRKEELEGLMKANVFEIVNKSEVGKGSRIYGCRFVDTMKNTIDGTYKAKSRLVAQNYNDKDALSIMTRSPTVSRLGQRIAVATCPLFPSHTAYIRDVSQAYIQSHSVLNRTIYLKPPEEMNLPKNHVLLVKKPLYGIPESGLHWFLTYQSHHKQMLHMEETHGDKCILYRLKNNLLDGLTILQVDDSFGHGSKEFLDDEERESHKFKCKPRQVIVSGSNVQFNGANIYSNKANHYGINQADKLRNLKIPINHDELTSTRAQIQYIASCTRPDLSSPVQLMAAELNDDLPQTYKKLKKLVKWCHDTCDIGLQYVPLDADTLRLVLFTDAAFGNGEKLNSQLGFILLLVDGNNDANIIHYGSTKCRRVARSVLAAELHALIYGFDQAYLAQHIIQTILCRDIPLDAYVDSRTVFNIVAKSSPTLEKRLQIDVHALRQSHEKGELRYLAWIPGKQNCADALTRHSTVDSNHSLWTLITTNKIHLTPQGWIHSHVRSAKQSENA